MGQKRGITGPITTSLMTPPVPVEVALIIGLMGQSRYAQAERSVAFARKEREAEDKAEALTMRVVMKAALGISFAVYGIAWWLLCN